MIPLQFSEQAISMPLPREALDVQLLNTIVDEYAASKCPWCRNHAVWPEYAFKECDTKNSLAGILYTRCTNIICLILSLGNKRGLIGRVVAVQFWHI